ncbi:hypothetical protein [Halomarina oriensis]|uniref:Uncharacterized protein n=1 Tax=Halomarina oriensis TaxID=671145 RepID=A0A6B0GNS9_9EURY|nr:hypothetical protein [Halomarina oriensis]MWG36444.1 hypothetical protein [Halomarina oriensis]
MSDPVAVKHALAGLADGPPSDEAILTTADHARSDLDAAASFVESGGLARLRRVVDRTGEGRGLLLAFDRYREACRGAGHQFRPGHVTDLSPGPKDVPD